MCIAQALYQLLSQHSADHERNNCSPINKRLRISVSFRSYTTGNDREQFFVLNTAVGVTHGHCRSLVSLFLPNV